MTMTGNVQTLALSEDTLLQQNETFAGTAGVSENNRHLMVEPGFYHQSTGESCRSRFANGLPAPVHLLDGLPDAWVSKRDSDGRVAEACKEVIAGFLYRGEFYTREQAARLLA